MSGEASATQISTINSSNGNVENNSDIDGSGITKFTGTASALITSIALLDDKPTAQSPATIELDAGATDAADIKTLEGYEYISTVDGSNLDEINGSTEDITDALTALTNESSNWDSTISGTIDEDELKTINLATQGTITLVDANKGQSLSGTAANLLAALNGIDNFEGNITFEEDDTDASDVLAVVALTDSEATFTGTAMRRISGSASDVLDALTALGDNTPGANMTSVTLSGAAEGQDIVDIKNLNYVPSVDGTTLVPLLVPHLRYLMQ